MPKKIWVYADSRYPHYYAGDNDGGGIKDIADEFELADEEYEDLRRVETAFYVWQDRLEAMAEEAKAAKRKR